VALLDGRPLLVHTIDAALAAREVDCVVVSTDDPEIAEIAHAAGAMVSMRPASLSDGKATSESALCHTLGWLKEEHGMVPEWTVFLQCTSPLTESTDIDGTIQAVLDQNADSGLAVTRFHHFLWRNTDSGEAEGVNHDKRVRLRRQDSPSFFLETGAVYVMRTTDLQRGGHRFFGQVAMYEMPRERCWEIDDPTDLVVARALIDAKRKQEARHNLPFSPEALVLDFDGVFTDNSVLVFADGTEAVRCNRSDGAGLARLKRLGLPMLVLSAEVNAVVKARCAKLGIPCIHGVADKAPRLQKWLERHRINKEKVIYIGNDLADVPCMQWVGCGVAVADAFPEVKDAAQIVLRTAGGHGAIRELTDLILASSFQRVPVKNREVSR